MFDVYQSAHVGANAPIGLNGDIGWNSGILVYYKTSHRFVMLHRESIEMCPDIYPLTTVEYFL